MATAAAQKSDTRPASSIAFNDRYSIRPDEPLPEFCTPSALAFAAQDVRPGGLPLPLVAIVVDPAVPYRLDALETLKGIETAGLMTLVDYGVIEWPAYSRKAMTILYERPMGGRVMPSFDGDFPRIEGHELLKKAMRPMARALRELAKKNLTHRAVRPTNMYWTTPEREAIVLGDCAAAPPGFDQPAVLEPVESALAHPAGRGDGRAADDLYALGASVLTLLMGRNPLARASTAEVNRAKILDGSYQVLTGGENVPIHLIEMIKGLVNDDPKTRWDHAALEDWLAGKRRPIAQSRIEKRAARGFEFRGTDYFSSRDLAIAFCAHWDTALGAVTDGRLEQWLRHSLDMDAKADAVAKAIKNRSNDSRGAGDDALLCRICLILDDLAPIRYRTVAAMPDGVGNLLAATVAKGADVNPIVKLLRRDVLAAWAETHAPTKADPLLAKALEALSSQALGQGIERVLYMLCDSLPCQSPLLAKDFVVDVHALLPALERAAKAAERKAWPIDRHVAAFVAVRATMEVERQLVDVNNSAPDKSALGMLNLLATLQWYLGPKQLPALGAMVGGLLKPIIDGYHSQKRRRELEREAAGPAGQGDLVALFRLLDDPEARLRDRQGYEKASADWQELEDEIIDVDKQLANHGTKAAEAGRRASALVSMSLAIVIVLVLAVAKHQ